MEMMNRPERNSGRNRNTSKDEQYLCEEDKEQTYMERHTNKIWQGKNGLFYTHLPDEKRTLICRKAKEDLIHAIQNYYDASDHRPTVTDLFYRWLNEKLELGEICKGSYHRYEADFKRFLEHDGLAARYIDTITEDELETFIRQTIASQHLSVKAYGGLRIILIGIFKYAKKKKYTNISISSFFGDLSLSRKIFRTVIKTKEEQVFSEAEIPLILDWLMVHPDIIHYGIALTFYTGIRSGELAALKYSDLVGDELHIQRQMIAYNNPGEKHRIYEIAEYTKTEAGNRYVILPEEAISIIHKIKELNPDHEYMFMKNNKLISKYLFTSSLYHVCDALNIPRRSMHKIRKTYGTTLVNYGVDEFLIKEQMGHSDISTTKRYYYYSNRERNQNKNQIDEAVKFAVNH